MPRCEICGKELSKTIFGKERPITIRVSLTESRTICKSCYKKHIEPLFWFKNLHEEGRKGARTTK